jgi:hypothetical protein
MQVTILDEHGTSLATGQVETWCTSADIRIRPTRGAGSLLLYYFGQCGRGVWLEGEGVRLPGSLWTCWLGREREWRIKLRSPVAPDACVRPVGPSDAPLSATLHRYPSVVGRSLTAGITPFASRRCEATQNTKGQSR